jgi:hypothetical protein
VETSGGNSGISGPSFSSRVKALLTAKLAI